jgi:hypothetical protein
MAAPMLEQKPYLEQLPPGINHLDDDPYILKLKEKYPGRCETGICRRR